MGTMKPVEPDWVESGWLRNSATYEINAAPDRVWALLADATRWSDWHESLSMFETVDGGDLGLDVRFRSKEWVFNNEGIMHEWDPGRTVGFTLTAGTFSSVFSRYSERIEITPGDSPTTCSVDHSGRIAPTGFGWLLAGYVLGQALGAMYFDYRASVRNLAALAEAAEH